MAPLADTKAEVFAKYLTVTTATFFILAGAASVFFEIKPFWLDEWSLIDNLKFRPAGELWGVLHHVQQFPRVYLQLARQFAEALDYSYLSLRMPSFLVHSISVIAGYKLAGHLFKGDPLARYFWVLLYISSKTSIQYFVQFKQYTMEMALGIAGLWQLLSLLRLGEREKKGQYTLLCASFVVLPFFSYTYVIVILPAFAVFLGLTFLRDRRPPSLYLSMPVLLGVASIGAFYLVDARQVLQDSHMQNYWKEYMMTEGFNLPHIFERLYLLFFNLGTGSLFGAILGLLGISGWIYATVRVVPLWLGRRDEGYLSPIVLYSALLSWLIVLLFLAGKLPLGNHRLNAFATPALGVLILFAVNRLGTIGRLKRVVPVATLLLLLGVAGNVYVAVPRELTSNTHDQQLLIYRNVAQAIQTAEEESLPLMVTRQIAYPFPEEVEGDWVLKTHPRYRKSTMIPVYPVNDEGDAMRVLREKALSKGIFVDGATFRVVRTD